MGSTVKGACALALVLAAGCGSGKLVTGTATTKAPAASTTSTPSPASSTSTPPSSPSASAASPAPRSPGAASPATPSGTASIASSGAIAATASAATASATSLPAASVAPARSSALAAAPATGAVLRGTVPADPATGFSGILWLAGERLVPGSSVLVRYQGIPTKVLPGIFHSSEVLGVLVFLTVPGDYELAAVAPDGTQSNPVALTVASGGALGAFTVQDPAVRGVFPPSLDTSFAGTVWLLGEHFVPGATLLVSSPGSSVRVPAPLVFVNERVAGWVTATPLAQDLVLEVVNPTLRTSAPVVVPVKGAARAATGAAPAPALLGGPPGVSSPFLGPIKVYGKGLAIGARLELRDVVSNTTTVVPLLLLSPAEAWATLAFPAVGRYDALIRNPDGQATRSWSFEVK